MMLRGRAYAKYTLASAEKYISPVVYPYTCTHTYMYTVDEKPAFPSSCIYRLHVTCFASGVSIELTG